jgi:hypothetical protein
MGGRISQKLSVVIGATENDQNTLQISNFIAWSETYK